MVADMGPRPSGSDWSFEYNSDVFVYDTQQGVFGRALGTSTHDLGLIPDGCGAFPINNNLPQVGARASPLIAICRTNY